MIPLLAIPAVRWAIGAVLGAALVLGAVTWLRHDAANDAMAHAAARAAQGQERLRHEAETAARDAERDGAIDRLRSGGF